MSRDQGAANGGPVREPRRCTCGRLETLHPVRGGKRRGLPSLGCSGFEAAATVTVLTIPVPPPRHVDLNAIGDRYTDLLEARARGDEHTAGLLAHACADDVPLLREEIHRLTVALGRPR
ncbi:hypothetical protein AB0875_12685 [Micromonospora gifhornensis]|uniref:hypothetical protein n=1 Tax=Micromonospora gifhornensis TaxID=84594 RepID=UPI00345360D3